MSQAHSDKFSLEMVNAMTRLSFIQKFAHVLEGAPHLVARLWHLRPFASVEDMTEGVWEILQTLSHKERLAFIRSRPWKAPVRSHLESPDSLNGLLAAYHQRFSFPFVFSGESANEALEALRVRLHHGRAEEISAAMTEICESARRLLELSVSKPE